MGLSRVPSVIAAAAIVTTTAGQLVSAARAMTVPLAIANLLKLWVAAGSPAQCVQSLQRYVEAGATTILLRVVGYDQKGQFKRVTEEVLPAFS